MAKGLDWIKISSDIAFDDDLEHVSDAAFRTFIELIGISAYHLTDGKISSKVSTKRCNTRKLKAAIEELEEAGLVELAGDEIIIPNYQKHQQTREEVEEQRAATRERVRRYRESSNDDCNGVTNGDSNTSKSKSKSKSKKKEEGDKPPDFVGFASDYAKEIGRTLDGRTKGHLGKRAKELHQAGADPPVIQQAIRRLVDENKSPEQLRYLVRDAEGERMSDPDLEEMEKLYNEASA